MGCSINIKYEYCLLALCFAVVISSVHVIHALYLPVFFRVASLALGQSYDCPSASEVTLNYMGEIGRYQNRTQNTTKREPGAWFLWCVFYIPSTSNHGIGIESPCDKLWNNYDAVTSPPSILLPVDIAIKQMAVTVPSYIFTSVGWGPVFDGLIYEYDSVSF